MEKKQTAVQFLEEQLRKQGFLYDLDIEAAKRLEREQIEEAYKQGGDWEELPQPKFNNYYTQTFKL